MVSHEEIMARVAAGELSALELLFARVEGLIFSYFYRLGVHPSWIEDLTEETLVVLYRQRARYDPARPFLPWLYGIARLVWKDHLRHRGRQIYGAELLESATASTDPGPLRRAEEMEEAALVRSAIRRLPGEQREALILRHYHGLTYDEIATAVGAPLGTVKWRIHEAMRRLAASVVRMRESRE